MGGTFSTRDETRKWTNLVRKAQREETWRDEGNGG
jgi:hypothetical protein